MTPELMAQINATISAEHKMNLIEQHHMAIDQIEGYPGFKRQHRYNSRWRNESAICLTNYVLDNYGHMPEVNIAFASPPAPENYEAGIRSIIAEYESLRIHWVTISRLAFSANLDELMQLASEKIKWIAKTKMKYYRDLAESTGKTNEYIQLRSEAMHEKYKLKEEKFSIDY